MNEYTPTNDEVREDFAYPWEGHPRDREGRLAAFDRWLAAHDREVKAEAWDERGKVSPSYLGPDNGHYDDCLGWEDCWCATYPNPYRGATA